MKRLWSALLTSVLAAAAAPAQSPVPSPRALPPESAPSTKVPTLSIPSSPTVPTATVAETNAQADGPGCCAQAWRNGCCPHDAVCGPPGRVWGEIDYILWQPRGDPVPPLLTTSKPGTSQALAGVLGAPDTSVLFGGNNLNDNVRSGVRLNLGAWLNAQQTLGIQAGAIFLADGSEGTSVSSNGTPILARPFINAINGAPSSQIIAFPGIVSGNFSATDRSTFDAFDLLLRSNICCGPQWRLDTLLGYRHLRLADQLRISNSLTAGAGAPVALGVPAGTKFSILDTFDTSNTFNGVEVGFAGEYRFLSRLFVNGSAKFAYGYLNQEVDIHGATTLAVPGIAPVTSIGGLLAQTTNIRNRTRSEGQLIPELNLNLGYEITSNVRVRVGYTFLYMDNVFRPGKAIDERINPNLIPPATGAPTPARPIFNEERVDFYLQGINAGLEIRF